MSQTDELERRKQQSELGGGQARIDRQHNEGKLTARERIASARDQIRPVARQLLERAKAAGVLREDFDDFDIPMLQFAVGHVADLMRDVSPQYHQRLLTLLLDGMVARRPDATPMPAAPLTPEQFARGASCRR